MASEYPLYIKINVDQKMKKGDIIRSGKTLIRVTYCIKGSNGWLCGGEVIRK